MQYIADISLAYLNFLYATIFTVTGIGYFAYNIATTNQRLIIILVMCSDIIIFAYILGKIQSTLDSYTLEGKETQRLLKMCKVFSSQNHIPNTLRRKILKYITFCRENARKSVDKETEILSNLSIPLREEIFTQTRGFMLAKHPVFKMYPQTFLRFIGYHLKLQIFGPQDLIFEQGENSAMVYFIQSGSVEIYHSLTGSMFKKLKKGRCFGEISFFLGITRTASAKSETFSELLALPKTIMDHILSCRPVEKLLTDELIDSTEKSGLSVLHIRCYLCKKLGHVATTCKDYVISIDVKNINSKVDNKKFKSSKNINLNDPYKFTFQRSQAIYSQNNYKAVNTIGNKPINIKNSFNSRPSLLKKALNFQMRHPLTISKKNKLSLLEEDDSSGGENSVEKSPLPPTMQYRNAFIERSKNRKQDRKIIELFDVGDYPKIYLNSPE